MFEEGLMAYFAEINLKLLSIFLTIHEFILQVQV